MRAPAQACRASLLTIESGQPVPRILLLLKGLRSFILH
jgi:hypothetical protein